MPELPRNDVVKTSFYEGIEIPSVSKCHSTSTEGKLRLIFADQILEQASRIKLLGSLIDIPLSWRDRIDYVTGGPSSRLEKKLTINS